MAVCSCEGPKPATRGGVNGSRSKFLPKFKQSAYIPKITKPSSVLAKVWNSYGKAKPTQKASNVRAKPRSKSEANRKIADLSAWKGLTGALPVLPTGLTGGTPKTLIQTVNLDQTTTKIDET